MLIVLGDLFYFTCPFLFAVSHLISILSSKAAHCLPDLSTDSLFLSPSTALHHSLFPPSAEGNWYVNIRGHEIKRHRHEHTTFAQRVPNVYSGKA